MYYLLENNSIHYDGDKKKIQSATYDFERKEMSINGGKWKKWIKHSENVFDLIELGDLVEYKHVHLTIDRVIDLIDDEYDLIAPNERYVLVEGLHSVSSLDIAKIYKPNKNGDYIKVWERENEKWQVRN